MNISGIKQRLFSDKETLLKKEKATSKEIELNEKLPLEIDLASTSVEFNKTNITRKEIDLNLKIDAYFNWYLENILSKEEHKNIQKLKKFIDKMAIWYELRYPDYEIEKMMDEYSNEDKDINEIMFQENIALKEYPLEPSISKIEWSDFYNTKVFIQSLTDEEKQFLKKPKYLTYIPFNFYSIRGHLYLSSKGTITDATVIKKERKKNEYGCSRRDRRISDQFQGHSIVEFFSICEKLNIELNELERKSIQEILTEYEKFKYAKEELLNCVMYKILERGGFYAGPRRAYLFAKEFHINIDIPIQYAMTNDFYGPENLFNLYLKDGGNLKLKCYDYYFLYPNKEIVPLITIEEYFKKRGKYHILEVELYQRFVNSIVNYQMTPLPKENSQEKNSYKTLTKK